MPAHMDDGATTQSSAGAPAGDASGAFGRVLHEMTQAICRGDGPAAARCFTEHGVYHDGFYGEFAGREAIARLVSDFFHRDARDFTWRLFDPISDGRRGYARYEFTYVSRIPGCEGRPAGFPGVSICELREGLIHRYEELFDRGPVLLQLGFPAERVLKHLNRRIHRG